MNQGPRCDSLMKKIGGQKSRGTIPLTIIWAAGGVYDFEKFEHV
jgi:hypothetical protein